MAGAPVVITAGGDDKTSRGNLFDGLSFFLVQRVPLRSTYVEKIKNNGGSVAKFEKQADYLIADHVRKEAPAGSISYKFIDESIRNGALGDPSQHLAGPPLGTVRNVGSAIPSSSRRNPFTSEDDRILWEWVEECKGKGALVKGNTIYQQLEARNPRHTYQSWRDRYLKRLVNRPPESVNLESRTFTDDDFKLLLENAADIEDVPDENSLEAWGAWAQASPSHTANEWANFYKTKVRPVYLEQRSEISQEDAGYGKRKRKAQATPTPERQGGIKKGKIDTTSMPSSSNARRRVSWDSSPTGSVGTRALTKDKVGGESVEHMGTTRTPPEINQAADQQLQREEMESAKKRKHQIHGTSSFNSWTSRFGSGVDGQIWPGSAPSGNASINENEGNEDAEDVTSNLLGEKSTDGDDNTNWNFFSQPKTTLTEANLANQQAQHQAQLLRGVDLPEDDPKQDQSDYASYLQTITNISVKGDIHKLGSVKSVTNAKDTEFVTKSIHFQSEPISKVDDVDRPIDDQQLPSQQEVEVEVEDSELDDASGEIDLALPEPDGGFELSPSSNRSPNKPPRRTPNLRRGGTTNTEKGNQLPRRPRTANGESPTGPQLELREQGPPSESTRRVQRSRALETQDIFHAETQAPDLNIPLPPESDDDMENPDAQPPNPSHQATSRRSRQKPEKLGVTDLEEWTATMQFRGFSRGAMIRALKCTSMRPDLAELVLLEEKSGRGFPSDVPGIWSEVEDQQLEGGNGKLLEDLTAKHGDDEYYARLKFLSDWRDL